MATLPGYVEYPMDGVSAQLAESLAGVEKGQVFHGHLLSSPTLFDFLAERAFATIYVYRDLRDVVVSDYHHRAFLNPNRAPAIFAEKSKEELLMADALVQWCGSVKRYPDVGNWIEQSGIPTVRYEDLKSDGPGTFHRALEEMGLVIERALVEQIVADNAFSTRSGREPGEEVATSPLRKGIVGDWRNHFTAKNIESFKEAFGQMLIDYGYESDFDW